MLAKEFVNRGHEVVVVTGSPSQEADDFAFRVVRRPGKNQFLGLVRWCDVFFQNNISLKMLWPLLLLKRPWVVAHHTWIRRADGLLNWQDRLKRGLLRFATGISISQAIAADIPGASTVIGNPYSDDLFRILPDVERNRDIVFLGRLVSDKGAHLLIEALKILRLRGLNPSATIIGSGPEQPRLQQQVAEHGLEVEFVGQKSGEELVRLLNQHRIMVVPSVWNEPFGLVALEGMACGCVVVGSEGGGLKDAIGSCGITFPNGNVDALSHSLERLLRAPGEILRLLESVPRHLSDHRAQVVADRYLGVMACAVKGRK